MNKAKICCFTGHRRIPREDIVRLPALLDSLLESLIDKGVLTFRAGGAIGFDTLCALKVLELKKRHPSLNITLELCLPCRDQTPGWSATEKSAYEFVLKNADKVSYASQSYAAGCMHTRNRTLVEGADVCVAYLTSSKGGTAYTCAYALKHGLEFINTAELLRGE